MYQLLLGRLGKRGTRKGEGLSLTDNTKSKGRVSARAPTANLRKIPPRNTHEIHWSVGPLRSLRWVDTALYSYRLHDSCTERDTLTLYILTSLDS